MASSTSPDSAHPLEDSPNTNTGGSATSRPRSDNTRGPTLPISDHLEEGQRIELWLNIYNQPDFPEEGVSMLSSEAARLADREIPCFYKDWPTMMKLSKGTHYNRIIKSLNDTFVFVNGDEDKGVDCKYVRDKVMAAWRSHKGELKKKYVAGKDPEIVKMKAPDGILLEDWKAFVNHCHSDEFKALSVRNIQNRAMQIEPNCGGRTLAQVYRRKIAKKQGVSVEEVDRGDMYVEMHTLKKTGTPQRQSLADKISQCSPLNSNMTSNSDFEACDNDVVTEVVGKDSRGRMRVMGSGVSKSSFKHSAPYRKRYQKQIKVTEELKNQFEKKIDELKDSFDGKVNQINETVQNLVRQMPPTCYSPVGPSSSGSHDIFSQGPDYMNAEVNVRAFWPLRKVASGRVKQVDPTFKIGDRTLGDGKFLVYIEAITVGSCELPKPYNHFRPWSSWAGTCYLA